MARESRPLGQTNFDLFILWKRSCYRKRHPESEAKTYVLDGGRAAAMGIRENDFEQWLNLWDSYNRFYGRFDRTALPTEITVFAFGTSSNAIRSSACPCPPGAS